jgi:proteasome accessory factor A
MDLLSRQGNRLRSLFDDVQRFQLGMSDSNMAQFAEYLKVGTTHLILRMAEQGFLVDAPELSDPMTALQKINQDSSLQVSVDIQGGGEWTALSIQQWYWRRAQQFVQESSLCFLEDVEVVRLWGECLDRLSDEPSDLFGRVDWVTKLALLEGAGKGLSYEEKKRIDLQYHELDTGFYADIQKEGLTLSLVEEHAIEEAMNEPSSPEKVQLRAHLIRTLHEKGIDISVNWDSIYIGGWAEREVIDLNRYRKNKSSQTK